MVDNSIIKNIFSYHNYFYQIIPNIESSYDKDNEKTMLKAFGLRENSTEEEKSNFGLNKIEEDFSIKYNNGNEEIKCHTSNYEDDILICNTRDNKKLFFTKKGIIVKNKSLIEGIIEYDEKLVYDILEDILINGNFDFSPESNTLKIFDIITKYTNFSKRLEENFFIEMQENIAKYNISEKNKIIFTKALSRVFIKTSGRELDGKTFKPFYLNNLRKQELVEDIYSSGAPIKIRIINDYFKSSSEKKDFLLKAFKGAFRNGNLDIIEFLFDNFESSYSSNIKIEECLEDREFVFEILKSASIGGHLEAFEYLFEKCQNFFDLEDNKYLLSQLIELSDNPNINEIIINKLMREFRDIDIIENSRINDQKKLDLIKKFTKILGIDLNKKNNADRTILFEKVREKNYYMVNELINIEGIDINEKNEMGITALHCAIENHDKDIVSALCSDSNLNINLKNDITRHSRFALLTENKNKNLQKQIIYNFINGKNKKISDNFNKNGRVGNFNERKVENLHMTPLTFAIIENNSNGYNTNEIIDCIFLNQNLDVNIKNEQILIPPIFLTIIDDNDYCFDKLINHPNINPNLTIDYKEYKNITPLHFAIMGNSGFMVSKLLNNKNINLNTEIEINKNGEIEKQTPLQFAVKLYKEEKINNSIIIEILKHLKVEEIEKESKLKEEIEELANNAKKFKQNLLDACEDNMKNALSEIVKEINAKKNYHDIY